MVNNLVLPKEFICYHFDYLLSTTKKDKIPEDEVAYCPITETFKPLTEFGDDELPYPVSDIYCNMTKQTYRCILCPITSNDKKGLLYEVQKIDGNGSLVPMSEFKGILFWQDNEDKFAYISERQVKSRLFLFHNCVQSLASVK